MVRAQTVVAVLATGALLGAGGAFAANKVLIKGSNVVDGSLTGKDLKDGSIQQRDLSSSLRARLARVGVAANGPQGPQGAPGAQGPQGPPGLTVANAAATPASQDVTAATVLLSIDSAAAGWIAQATVDATGKAGSTQLSCSIKIGTVTKTTTVDIGNGDVVTLPVLAAGQLTAPGQITLSCTGTGGSGVTINKAVLVTTQVSRLTTDGY